MGRTYDLRQIRALLKMNQEEMAELLQIHRVTYGKLEQNPKELTLGQAHIIAELAKIGIEQIQV